MNFQPNYRHEILDPIGQAHVIAVSGELDAFTKENLSQTIDQVMSFNPKELVFRFDSGAIDHEEGLSYFSASGAGLLIRTLKTMREIHGEDCRVVIICGQSPARKVLEISGLSTIFDLYDSIEEYEQSNMLCLAST